MGAAAEMNLATCVLGFLPAKLCVNMLAFGSDARALGLAMVPANLVSVLAGPADPVAGETLIAALVTEDPRIVQTLDGHWVRSVTIEEVFTQFPGPYDVIAAINTDRDRTTWQHQLVFNALPKVYVLGEDGHNEGVR